MGDRNGSTAASTVASPTLYRRIALLTFMFLLTVVAAAGDFMRSPEFMPHKAGVLISGWAILCVSLVLILFGKGWGRLAPPIAALCCVLLWTVQFFWD